MNPLLTLLLLDAPADGPVGAELPDYLPRPSAVDSHPWAVSLPRPNPCTGRRVDPAAKRRRKAQGDARRRQRGRR